MRIRIVIILLIFIGLQQWGIGQDSKLMAASSSKDFWIPSDTLNHKRFNLALGITSGAYVVASYGLYQAWYKQNKIGKFHFFNDNLEWGGMDKYGHFYSAYMESVFAYKVAKWSGLNTRKSIVVGVLTGSIIQSTIEVMDGFSDKWGFSYGDMIMNAGGITAFVLQEHYWGEQRIQFKVSSFPRSYKKNILLSIDGIEQSSLSDRANALFGSSFLERYLKDYNAQTYWASFNVTSFLPTGNRFPNYVNIALGYGVENMFGGFENVWLEDGHEFRLMGEQNERYHQFYIGLDIDFSKIVKKHGFWKTLLTGFNMFKLPAPAIEFNTKGEVIFHLVKI